SDMTRLWRGSPEISGKSENSTRATLPSESCMKIQAMNSFCVPVEAIKGRGTATRHPHRFQQHEREAFDDGWEGERADAVPAPKTEVTWEDPRSVLVDVASPDVYFERSLNPYRGCEHVM